MKKNIDILNYYKERLQEINIGAEVLNIVEDIAQDLESLTYGINEKYFVNMFFIPDTEEQFEKLRLLQFTCIISYADFIKNNQYLLLKVLNNVNASLPIGSLVFTNENQILYKYVLTSNTEELIESVLFHEFISVINNVIQFSLNLLNQNNEEDLNSVMQQIS